MPYYDEDYLVDLLRPGATKFGSVLDMANLTIGFSPASASPPGRSLFDRITRAPAATAGDQPTPTDAEMYDVVGTPVAVTVAVAVDVAAPVVPRQQEQQNQAVPRYHASPQKMAFFRASRHGGAAPPASAPTWCHRLWA